MAKTQVINVSPPQLELATFKIIGTAPFVANKFSEKARQQLHETHAAGSTAKKGKAREAKDFAANFESAHHRSVEGWCGIPATAFRNALISACKMVGIYMTRAKLSLFVHPDGFDATDGTPLVKILVGEPVYTELPVRNSNGEPDLRARPMWREGWEATVKIEFDKGQFTAEDVTNLLMRVGVQVGVGEGRPDSPNSAGMGWGLFRLAQEGE